MTTFSIIVLGLVLYVGIGIVVIRNTGKDAKLPTTPGMGDIKACAIGVVSWPFVVGVVVLVASMYWIGRAAGGKVNP